MYTFASKPLWDIRLVSVHVLQVRQELLNVPHAFQPIALAGSTQLFALAACETRKDVT